MDRMVCSRPNSNTNTNTSTCCIAIILGAMFDCNTHRGAINLYGKANGTFGQPEMQHRSITPWLVQLCCQLLDVFYWRCI